MNSGKEMSNKEEIKLILFFVGGIILGGIIGGLSVATHQIPFQKSDEYWNQVHVSEYLAEKTWNGNAQVILAGLGRVIVNVDGKAYEYSCKGTFNCTEGFTNENVGNYYVGANGTQ